MADMAPWTGKAMPRAFTEYKMTQGQCRFFSDLALKVSRINIDPGKADFLQLRLSRRVRALNLDGFEAYECLLKSSEGRKELRSFIEALTTHTTSFFRERHQYDWLESSGIEMLSKDGAGFDRPLVIWSAACSTGAELWSAAMVFADQAGKSGGIRRFSLLGSDISHAILKKAKGGTYTEDEISGLSPERRQRYLMRSRQFFADKGSHFYRIVPELRNMANFFSANLTEHETLPPIVADVVFLRNVLIYFRPDMQAQAIEGVVAKMHPGAVLLTGHAEAIPSHPLLKAIGPSIYRKE